MTRTLDLTQRKGLRVLVCGGRDFRDKSFLFATLDRLHRERGIAVIIHGDANGTDYLANRWAGERPVHVLAFPADWNKHGRAAGPIRNQRMLDEGKPDLVVAFPGGRGTEDMKCKARKAGITVIEIA